MQITAKQVKDVSLGFGRADLCASIADMITKHGDSFFLDTVYRIKHFLGQTCIESNFYRSLEENLNYSAGRLMEVWPKRFPTLASATPYAKNPQALANKTYGGRMGNYGANDGWLYRGSSIKQITGKDNFTAFNTWIHKLFPDAPDFVANPDYLRSFEWAVWPAVWYWVENKCYVYADRDDAKGLTKVINGGYTMLDERIKATAVAAKVLNSATQPVLTAAPPRQPDLLLKEMQEKMTFLSKKLNRPDCDPKGADGWMGENTAKAAMAIQSFTNLKVDGKIGPNTRKAINLLYDKYK